MGNPGGLPKGFELCPCENCCPKPKTPGAIPAPPTSANSCGGSETPGCYCEMFYHHAPGSKSEHQRYLALPGKSGYTAIPGEIYEYRCVKARLPQGSVCKGLCGEPTTVPEGGTSNNVRVLCKGTCAKGAGTCTLYFIPGGEPGHNSEWAPVTKDAEGLEGSFSTDANDHLVVDRDKFEELKKKFRFRCFCVVASDD